MRGHSTSAFRSSRVAATETKRHPACGNPSPSAFAETYLPRFPKVNYTIHHPRDKSRIYCADTTCAACLSFSQPRYLLGADADPQPRLPPQATAPTSSETHTMGLPLPLIVEEGLVLILG